MIATVVEFQLSDAFTPDRARTAFRESAAKFLKMRGLIRKYYLLSEEGTAAAGVYLWEAREPAEAFFSEEWKCFMKGKYGDRPTVTYYECPVVVDNLTGETIFAE